LPELLAQRSRINLQPAGGFMTTEKSIIKEPYFYPNMALSYRECRSCRYVVKREASSFNSPCEVCATDTPHHFFDFGLLIVIDIMEESYSRGHLENSALITPSQAQNASVVVYFCTIKEVLLHRFLDHFLREFALPVSFLDQWDDHFFTYRQRREKLLPSLIGVPWNEAISQLQQAEHDFKSVSAFLKRATDARDLLLHEADHVEIDENIARECFVNLQPLLELYVALHNKYVHPLRMNNVRKTQRPPPAG
jgi:hypothetical protein